MEKLLSLTQEPWFKWFLLILLVLGGGCFLINFFKGGFEIINSSSPFRGIRFFKKFTLSALNIVTILAIFVLSILINTQGENDLAGQFFSSLCSEYLGPLLDAVDFRNKIDPEPLLLFYYFFLTCILNLIVGIIKFFLDRVKSKRISYWWFTESVTIVLGTFLFVLVKNGFESKYPVEEINGLTFIIITGVITVVTLIILIANPQGFLGDLFYTIPMALVYSFFTMGIAVVFSLMGGLSWMKKFEVLFKGPISLPNIITYIVLLIIFIFLWYFVWTILHAF